MSTSLLTLQVAKTFSHYFSAPFHFTATTTKMKLAVSPAACLALSSVFSSVGAFTTTPSSCRNPVSTSETTELYGLFDGFKAQGSGKDRLDEEWEAQQEILRLRNGSQQERDNYFTQVSKRRIKADKEQKKNWAWQTKQYVRIYV